MWVQRWEREPLRKNRSLAVSGVKSNHPLGQIYLLSAYKLSLPCRPYCRSLNSNPYYHFPILCQRLPSQSVALIPLAASSRVPLSVFSLPGHEAPIPPWELAYSQNILSPTLPSLHNSYACFRLHRGSTTPLGSPDPIPNPGLSGPRQRKATAHVPTRCMRGRNYLPPAQSPRPGVQRTPEGVAPIHAVPAKEVQTRAGTLPPRQTRVV